MQTADSLMKIFNCNEDKDLADIFGRDKSVVSHWRKKGLPAAIEKRAFELMQKRGVVDPQTPYGVGAVHRKITPEEEQLLQILESDPDIRDAVKAMIELPPRKRKIHLGKMFEDLEKLEEGKD